MDMDILQTIPRFNVSRRDYQDGGLIRVGIAHAIPQITNKNIIEEGKKFHPVSAGVILSTLTDININILEDLADNRIYRLEKITSVEQACNRAFDELVLWLKPMEPLSYFGQSQHV